MSKVGFCRGGGMEGIKTTMSELNRFAHSLKREHLDEVIPLPNKTIKEQKESLKTCTEHPSGRYWETNTGLHGWCCRICGTVTQWG
jgi:hypothetical protein